MRFNKLVRFLSIVVSTTILMVFILGDVVYAAVEYENALTVYNDFVEYAVNRDTGRFSIRTREGHPLKDSDSDKSLLFMRKTPETSFTTFKIDGKDYIFGNDYGFLGTDGQFIYKPSTNGYTNKSGWKVDGLEITQIIELIGDKTNPNVGNVKITYNIKNTTGQYKSVGTRILLDTMLGPNDASPVSFSGGSEFIHKETVVEGDDIPYYWKAVDHPLVPKVVSYGFLSGWGNRKPDRMIIAHWNGISKTKWDYEANTEMEFTSTRNRYGSADSAVALYWDPVTIYPGSERTFETYYGLGNFYTTKRNAAYGLQVFAPKKLTLDDSKEGYVEREFEIKAEIDNSTAGAQMLFNVDIEMGLSDELELCTGEERVKHFDTIGVNEMKTVTWKIMPKPQSTYRASQYRIKVTADGLEEVLHAGYVMLPALSGEPPSVQVMDITPNKIYFRDKEKSVAVKGKGFAMLQGNIDWSVSLVRNRDNAVYPIPRADVVVSNDGNMSIGIDDSSWNEGTGATAEAYTMKIDAGSYGKFEKPVEFTTEQKYKTRSYGILLVVGENISPERELASELGNETYSLVTVENEQQLARLRQEYQNTTFEGDKQILLEFRGNIKGMQDGADTIYEVTPGAMINSVIRYDTSDGMKDLYGEASQKITIRKITGDISGGGDYIEISGNGILSIPSFPFVFGSFSIELEDGTRYALDADEEQGQQPIEIKWAILKGYSVVQQMSFFPVEIKNAVIGDKWVSFGGSLSLNLGGRPKDGDKDGDNKDSGKDKDGNKDHKDDEDDDEDKNAAVRVSVDEARFGKREYGSIFGPAGSYGFIGLKTEGEVALPKDFIPGMGVGAEARLKIDTINNIYEIEAEVEFMVVELYGLFSLRFINGNIPIPDNFVFSVGGEPGIPLVPPFTVAFITKGGGGFKNLYDTVMGNFNILPPLKIVMIGGLQIAKVFEGDNITLEISLRGIEFSGELKIAKFPILKEVEGHFLIEDSLRKFGVSLGASARLNVFDILVGNVWFMFEFDSSKSGLLGPVTLGGGGRVALKIPDVVPLAGGYELASAAVELSTEKVYAGVEILKIPLSIEYQWGSGAPNIRLFSDASGETIEFEPLENRGLMAKVYYNEETGEPKGRMVIGSNIKRIASTRDGKIPLRPKKNTVLASIGGYEEYLDLSNGIASVPVILATQDKKEHSVDIQDQEMAIIELEYSGNVPKVELYDPSGNKVGLVENENYRIQEIPADISESGILEQRIYIRLENPANGQWKVVSDQPVECALLDVEIPPSLKRVSVSQTSDHAFNVSWQGDHATDEKVALYLCNDNTNDPGRKLVDNIDVSLGTYEYTLPDSLASGDYYIKAVLYKDNTNYSSVYGERSIHIVNPNQPASPSNVQLEAVGNGLFNVRWDPMQGIDGYYIQLLDENGNPVKGAGAAQIVGNQNEALIGGVFEGNNGEIIGMQPGRAYKVSVVAYRIIDDIRHNSEPAYSQVLYLPEPDPADVTLGVRVEEEGTIKTAQDENDETYYIVNRDRISLSIDSDQQADMEVELNGEVVKNLSGTVFTEEIPLKEGKNVVNIHAINGNGDYSVSSAIIVSDTTPPELKVESPATNAVASGNEVLVKGVCEPGSVLAVDGQEVDLGEGGMFELTLPMNGLMQKDITIAAEDDAGNMTLYEASVINGSVAQFNAVKIKPAGQALQGMQAFAALPDNDVDSVEIGLDSTRQFELYGVDENGTEYRIAPEDVQWSILAGVNNGTLTNSGLVKALYEGEMVIKASYYVSEEYAFEDAVLVRIVTDAPGNGGDTGDDEQWYKKPSSPGDHASGSELPGDPGLSERLSNILNEIIKREKSFKLLNSVVVSGDKDTTVRGDDNMQLIIPAQEFASQVGVGIGRIDDTAGYESNHIRICSSIYEITLDRPIMPEEPFILKMKPDTSRLGDISPEGIGSLKVYWYNDIMERWEYVGGDYDSGTGTFTVKLPHLSKYALLYNNNLPKMEDIKGRPSEDEIYRLVSIGVVNGVPNGGKYYFEPERPVTRQEFAKLMVVSTDVSMATMYDEDKFLDMADIHSWAVPYVMAAVKREWIKGVPSDGGISVQPLKHISRAEAVTILGRILEKAGMEQGEDIELPYTDSGNIPSWALPYAKLLYGHGVIAEYTGNRFRPEKQVSREEAAVMISRMLDALYINGVRVK